MKRKTFQKLLESSPDIDPRTQSALYWLFNNIEEIDLLPGRIPANEEQLWKLIDLFMRKQAYEAAILAAYRIVLLEEESK